MRDAHERTTPPAVGDLKAALDRLQVASKEQKELLAILESTRPQVVSER